MDGRTPLQPLITRMAADREKTMPFNALLLLSFLSVPIGAIRGQFPNPLMTQMNADRQRIVFDSGLVLSRFLSAGIRVIRGQIPNR